MKVGRIATRFQFALTALILVGVGSLRALAQEAHSHTAPSQQHEMSAQ
jgi:hypothetical protein